MNKMSDVQMSAIFPPQGHVDPAGNDCNFLAGNANGRADNGAFES